MVSSRISDRYMIGNIKSLGLPLSSETVTDWGGKGQMHPNISYQLWFLVILTIAYMEAQN